MLPSPTRLSGAVVAGLAFLFLVPALEADWIDLSDGTTLRGFDYRPKGARASFSLEDGRTVVIDKKLVVAVRKGEPGERVEFRGRMVSLREKARVLRDEARKKEKEALRLLEKWARGKEAGEEARESFGALPAEEQESALAAATLKAPLKETRVLAAKELAARKSKLALSALSRAAVTDSRAEVRAECLGSLKTLEDPRISDQFIPYLKSPRSSDRSHAAMALEAFPSRRAVPALIDTLQLLWTGFGRGYFFQGEQRAYIADYELVSGGTGFSIIEVADPQIRTVTTGVILDAKIHKVEMQVHRRALRKITGQDFGADLEKWRDWWKSSEKAAAEPESSP